jgi:hypothetical protein
MDKRDMLVGDTKAQGDYVVNDNVGESSKAKDIFKEIRPITNEFRLV